MSNIKKVMTALMLMLVVMMLPIPAMAATQKDSIATPQYANIPADINTRYGIIEIRIRNLSNDTSMDYDVRVLDSKGKVIRYREEAGAGLVCTGLKKNQLYYYQIRQIRLMDNGGSIKYEWTKPVPFLTAQYPISQVGTGRKVRIKMPKIAGVKNYKVYMSYKKNSGWKKLKTLKSGNSIIISGFKGKALKANKNYYYKIAPNKGGEPTIGVIRFN